MEKGKLILPAHLAKQQIKKEKEGGQDAELREIVNQVVHGMRDMEGRLHSLEGFVMYTTRVQYMFMYDYLIKEKAPVHVQFEFLLQIMTIPVNINVEVRDLYKEGIALLDKVSDKDFKRHINVYKHLKTAKEFLKKNRSAEMYRSYELFYAKIKKRSLNVNAKPDKVKG